MRPTGSTWTSQRAPTAGAWAKTAWMPWTCSTPTPATIPSRTSRLTTRFESPATSCAPTGAAPANGEAAWAPSATCSSRAGRTWASKFQSRWAEPGDAIRTVSPCAAGYGDPLERDPQKVLDDVLDEFISPESARTQYGVVIDLDSKTVDHGATAELRAAMSRQALVRPA